MQNQVTIKARIIASEPQNLFGYENADCNFAPPPKNVYKYGPVVILKPCRTRKTIKMTQTSYK